MARKEILTTLDGGNGDIKVGFTSEGEMIVPEAGIRTASGNPVIISGASSSSGPAPSGGDDLPALQAAVDAAALSNIGSVVLGSGTYLVSNTLELPNRVALIGTGKRETIIKAHTTFPTTGKAVVRLGKAADSFAFDCYLQHMGIHGNDIAAVKGVDSIKAQEGSGLRSVVISNVKGSGYELVTGNNANVFNEDLEVYPYNDNSGACIKWSGVTNGMILKATVFGNGKTVTTDGIYILNSSVNLFAIHCESVTNGIRCAGDNVAGGIYGLTGPTGSATVSILLQFDGAIRVAAFGVTRNASDHACHNTFFDRYYDDTFIPDASALGSPFMFDPIAITPPASAGIWANATPFRVSVLIEGGTLTDTAIAKDGGVFHSCGPTRFVTLMPGNYVKVTYTGTITSMTGFPG